MTQDRVENPRVHELYHLAWARNRGYVWRLIKINPDGTCEMRTPKTKKTLIAKLEDLRYTNATIQKILKYKQNGQDKPSN